jgi:hypothetical protein
MCPDIAGGSLKETWKLISREYPTAVLKGNTQPAAFKTFAAKQFSGRISCSLDLEYSSPVLMELLDVKGRLIKTILKGNLSAGAYRYTCNIPAKTVGIVMLRVRTGTENRCIRIFAGAQ